MSTEWCATRRRSVRSALHAKDSRPSSYRSLIAREVGGRAMTTKADRRRKEQAKRNCIQTARIERGADPRTHQRRISVIIMTIVTSAAAHTISNLVPQSASWFSFVGTPTAEHLDETTSFHCFLGQPAPTVV